MPADDNGQENSTIPATNVQGNYVGRENGTKVTIASFRRQSQTIFQIM